MGFTWVKANFACCHLRGFFSPHFIQSIHRFSVPLILIRVSEHLATDGAQIDNHSHSHSHWKNNSVFKKSYRAWFGVNENSKQEGQSWALKPQMSGLGVGGGLVPLVHLIAKWYAILKIPIFKCKQARLVQSSLSSTIHLVNQLPGPKNCRLRSDSSQVTWLRAPHLWLLVS